MSGAYWVGVLTPIALVVALIILSVVYTWVRWWFRDGGERSGKGYFVEFESDEDTADGRWVWMRTSLYWPPDTPWRLVRWGRPFREWLFFRSPHHRRPQETP